jgi:iron-sulfur cluster repair protein YtfE (RIC family)
MPPLDDRLIAMNAAHAAFRRDLRRLAAVATPANLAEPGRHGSILTGWTIFKNQMRKHHAAEDTFIWPRLRERLATSEAAISTLDEMDAEHELIDPLLAAVDDAFGRPDPGGVAGVIDELTAKLSYHLDHEEREALPMIGEALSDQEWEAVTADIRQDGRSSAAEYIPWLTDGVSDAEAKRIATILPPPMVAAYRDVWKPAYDNLSRW